MVNVSIDKRKFDKSWGYKIDTKGQKIRVFLTKVKGMTFGKSRAKHLETLRKKLSLTKVKGKKQTY